MTLPSNSLTRRQPDSLADVLERVLDKGVVIAGDIVVNVLDIELLSLKLRLFVASAETAREMGMDWWTRDPFFNSQAEPVDGTRRGTAQHTVTRGDAPEGGDAPEISGSPPAVTARAEHTDADSARLAEENAQLRAALEELRDGRSSGSGDGR